MNTKPLFAFIGALLVAGIAFGFYVSGLEPCSRSSLGALECHKLYLAFGVLFAVAIMLALGAGLYALVDPPTTGTDLPGKLIFDSFAKIMPPIATLVLGYYFGSAQTQQSPPKDLKPTTTASTTATPPADAASPVKK